ncbi:guanylate kinase [Aurantimicrobium minutum]|nr:guanylate kinase [Aurantimicrobium minutum]
MPNVMPEVDRQAAAQAGVVARRKRAVIKSDVFEGRRSALDVFTVATIDPSSSEATIRVTDFLKSLRGVGVNKIPRILEELDVSPRKRLGGLGKHQKATLHRWILSYQRKRNESWPAKAVVLVGPSGVGKGTVVNHIKQHHPQVHLSISATTRDPRPGEIDGVNYYFIDHGEFDAMIYSESLLEWAEVHGQNKYGTPRGPIENALSEGKSVLFEIDLQGARQIRHSMPEARLVFLLPPDWDELVRRLRERGTESEEEIERRLQTAYGELAAKEEFDVRVINRDVSEAAQQVVDLMGLNKE